jgi:hypothetical protein
MMVVVTTVVREEKEKFTTHAARTTVFDMVTQLPDKEEEGLLKESCYQTAHAC